MFEIVLTGIYQELVGIKTKVDFGTFKVSGYKDFANNKKRA